MIVVPAEGAGPYKLGMLLNACVGVLKRANKTFALLYDELDPLLTDICLRVHDDGVNLRFEPRSQRLLLIDVYDLSKMQLSLCKGGVNTVFADGGDVLPTFLLIYELFGPTYPGHYNRQYDAYFLDYRGLCLLFPIPEEFRHLYQKDGDNDVPLELPDGTTPAATRFFIYHGTSVLEPTLPSAVASPVSSPSESLLIPAPVQVQLWGTMTVNFPSLGCSIGTCSSAQDVIHRLGTPPAVFFKGGSNHHNHPASHQAQSVGGATDYFFNYTHLGMDILFDACSHLLKKVVLHTNFPGHPEFHNYVKCHFKLLLPVSGVADPALVEPSSQKGADLVEIPSDCKWEEVQALYTGAGIQHKGTALDGAASQGPINPMATVQVKVQEQELSGTNSSPSPHLASSPAFSTRPMVHGSSTAAHPYGSTLLYAPFPGCVFEVMRNGHIASVALFQPAGRCAWQQEQQQYM